MNRTTELENLHAWAERLRSGNAPLGGLLDAFEPLFVELVKTRAALAAAGVQPIEPDTDRLARGIPQAVDAPLEDYGQALLAAARKVLPVMAQSFPAVSDELRKVMYALESDGVAPGPLMEGLIQGDGARIAAKAKAMGVKPDILGFAASMALRPVLQTIGSDTERAATIGVWGRGYCPVCGASPAMAMLRKSGDDNEYLKSHGGQRWLHCSRCASQWRFKRHACPHCDNEEHDTLEYFRDGDSGTQRADLCHKCDRYLVTYDATGTLEEPAPDMAAIGLLPLDMVMRRDGFAPVAETAWNRLDP